MQYRDPQLVVNEIKMYKEKYNINHVDFLDIVGVINRPWTEKLLQLMIEADLQISWIHGAGTRSEILDETMLNSGKLIGDGLCNSRFYRERLYGCNPSRFVTVAQRASTRFVITSGARDPLFRIPALV